MAWERLKTDYKDAVWSGLRKFIPIDNGDGSYSVKDVTQYTVYDESFSVRMMPTASIQPSTQSWQHWKTEQICMRYSQSF